MKQRPYYAAMLVRHFIIIQDVRTQISGLHQVIPQSPVQRSLYEVSGRSYVNMADLKSRKFDHLELPRTLLDSLNEMRNTGEHCDVFLRVEDEIFPAHRAVLAASSSYFRAMFSPSSSFCEAENSEVPLKSVDKMAVRVVVDYFYTGQLVFNHLNFENVLVLANLWDVPFLLSASEDFLQQELHVSNCLGVQYLVKKHQTFSSSFQASVDKFVLNNFMDVSNQQEFLSLSVDCLTDLLRQDLLRVKSEEIVFEAVLRWIEHDRFSRKQCLAELCREVRFTLMTFPYLTDRALREELVQQDSKSTDLVLQGLQQGSAGLGLCLKKREIDALYIFGGYLNNTGSQKKKVFLAQYLDCAMGNTKLEEFSPIRIGACHVASLGQFIYFNILNTNILTSFNKLTLAWESLNVSTYNTETIDTTSSMSCACQKFMYIVGGSCYRRFNPATNLWQGLPLPAYQHYRPGVCCLLDKVYVIGGCDKFYQESVNHVERFDTVNKAWETLSPLPTARWGAGVAVLKGMIYVAGG